MPPGLVVVDGMTTCNRCGYEWEYNGDLQLATCPSCMYKTEVAG